jgi:predicted anti-sigma-YlaC factor YlaD
MRELHPSEVELARWSDGPEADAGLLEHLRWCARCRNVASEYRWLQEEVSAALADAAATAPAPRPRWWAVQESLSAARRRQVAGWRLSAIAGVVLCVSLMLSTAPVLDTAVLMAQTAQVSSPEAAIATAPLTSAATPDCANPTPTPVVYRGGQGTADCPNPPSSTPVLILPPTPPRSDA